MASAKTRILSAFTLLGSLSGVGCGTSRRAPVDEVDHPATTRPAAGATARERRTVGPLYDLKVIGELGLPLGTVTEIRATVMAGRELDEKGHSGSYLLRVTQVGGRDLGEPVVMEFSKWAVFANVALANDVFDLYELKYGKRVGKLDGKQIEKLEQGYVGKEVHLIVYETGGFSGIPQNLPPEVTPWQDRGFGFYTTLSVLAERP